MRYSKQKVLFIYIKPMFFLLFLWLVTVSFLKPANASWPILNDPDMDKFVQTFPGMYREYKQLTLTVNPAAGATQKAQFDQEINRILTDNGWNLFFWIQMPHIIRCYSFVKQEQVDGAHGSDIEKFVRDVTNSDWLTPEHKSGLNDLFSQLKENYKTEAQKIKREVHGNDLNIVRRNIGGLDSVFEAITKVEVEAAQGSLEKANHSSTGSKMMPAVDIPAIIPSVAVGATEVMGSPQKTSASSISVLGRWRRTMDGFTVDVKEMTPGHYEGITVDAGGASHLYSAGEKILKLNQASDGTYKGTIKVKFFSRNEENWAPAKQLIRGNKMTGYGDWVRLATPSQSFSAPAVGPQDNPMLHQYGRMIVDGNGQPIKLRGTLAEGWLMWNGPLWGTGLNSETHIYKKIVELVGEEEAKKFRQKVYDYFFTEEDVKLMADMGFNVVRVPFNHTIIEDDANPYVYKESGWRLLDRLLQWCEKYGVYAVIDLHSAPGGQATTFVGDPEKELIWDSEAKKLRTIALWRAIATRYRDKKNIAGYDLLNEPHPHHADNLVDMYQRITAAIREVDPHHMVILQGSNLSTDFSMYTTLSTQPVTNMAYSFHTYNFFSSSIDKKQVEEMKKLSEQHQTPVWNSEFGANTTDWVRGTVDLYETSENMVSGWIYWPWKRVGEPDSKRWAGLMEIPHTPNWDKTRLWIGALFGLSAKPSKDEALTGMCELLQVSAPHNLAVNAQMAISLRINPERTTRQPDTPASIKAACTAD